VVHAGAHVEDSVLLDRVEVGPGARVRRAIVDKRVAIPDGVSVGYDAEQDARLGSITESGITVVPKQTFLG
jgi:glucose-1-phosphate adenylyltransferase